MKPRSGSVCRHLHPRPWSRPRQSSERSFTHAKSIHDDISRARDARYGSVCAEHYRLHGWTRCRPAGGVGTQCYRTVTEPAKKLTVSAKTNGEGDFYIAGLLPGNYTLAVEASGFKKLERPGIELNAQDKLALGNLPLEVGAVSESVEVSAQAALLQTESVERSQAIVGKQI